MAKPTRVDQLQHLFQFPGGAAVQVVRWTGERIHLSAADTASAATALSAGSKLVELRATEDCYVAFGGAGVAASQDEDSALFLRGVQIIPVPLDADFTPHTHVSVIRAGTDSGVLQVERVY